jgi:N-acetylneuraminic acid mutarotase
MYDPATQRWQTMTPMPNAISNAAFVIVNNQLLVFGGMGPPTISDCYAVSDVYAFDGNMWQTKVRARTCTHTTIVVDINANTDRISSRCSGGQQPCTGVWW